MIHGERYGRCIPLLEGVQVDVVQLERSLLLEDSTVRRQLLQIRVLVHDQLPLGHTQATLSCADDGVSSVLVVQPAADAIDETAESCLIIIIIIRFVKRQNVKRLPWRFWVCVP